ncbi:MAG: hypothetical protein IPG46_20440 [Actinobacteria bacterium]|nr:hypothetical protein [Actinomycetota bacterium]
MLIWFLARTDVIDGWTFLAAMTVFAFGLAPATPLFFSGVPGRRWAMEIWLGLGVVGALLIPWATAIESHGMRVVAILVYTLLVVRVAIGIHRERQAMMPNAPSVESAPRTGASTPPLTHAGALEAGRALGIDEEPLHSVGPTAQ